MMQVDFLFLFIFCIIASSSGTQELLLSLLAAVSQQLNETFSPGKVAAGGQRHFSGRNRKSRLVWKVPPKDEFRLRDGTCASAYAWRCIWIGKRYVSIRCFFLVHGRFVCEDVEFGMCCVL